MEILGETEDATKIRPIGCVPKQELIKLPFGKLLDRIIGVALEEITQVYTVKI